MNAEAQRMRAFDGMRHVEAWYSMSSSQGCPLSTIDPCENAFPAAPAAHPVARSWGNLPNCGILQLLHFRPENRSPCDLY